MFARLTINQIKIDRIDEFAKFYNENVVPDAKSQKGYCGIYLMADRKTGKGIAFTLWNSEEDALANEESRYYQEQLVKVRHFMTEPFIREGYEVEIHEKV